MYAVVRDLSYDPRKLAGAERQMAEFQELHASQPGYRGNLVVGVGNGRMLVVNLWESEDRARAALDVMVPAVQRLIEPLMTRPAELVGTGPVESTDLVPPRLADRAA